MPWSPPWTAGQVAPWSRWRAQLALLALAAGYPCGISAQEIRGRVIDDATDGPIAGVLVLLLNGSTPSAHAISDESGAFLLSLDGPGTYVLRAVRLGYENTEVAGLELPSDSTVLEFDLLMAPRPVSLEGLVVTAPRFQQDLDRLGLRAGDLGARILTREDLDAMGVREVADIIESRAPPGFDVMRAENVPEVLGGTIVTDRFPLCVRLARAKAADGTSRCALVVLDQSVVMQQVVEGLAPSDLEAVIFLNPVEATQIYGTMGGVGAVLLYTRRGR